MITSDLEVFSISHLKKSGGFRSEEFNKSILKRDVIIKGDFSNLMEQDLENREKLE